MTDDERITALETKADGLQKQIELLLTLRLELRSEVEALHQLLFESAIRLGCTPEHFRSVFEQNQKRYQQQLLVSVEDKHPALAMRMSAYRSLESVPGVDDPEQLYP